LDDNERRYIALLRGINVGGNKIIKMEALAAAFNTAGFRNVKTFIASGNVFFNSRSSDRDALTKKIEKMLTATFGHEIAVALFTLSELQEMISIDHFHRIKPSKDVMLCVTLFSKSVPQDIPSESKAERLKVVAMHDRAAFIIARRKPTGWFGYPNNWIEKEFGVTGTTRGWGSLKEDNGRSAGASLVTTSRGAKTQSISNHRN
jgi:uncharacterized protein (DUF1697 family)